MSQLIALRLAGRSTGLHTRLLGRLVRQLDAAEPQECFYVVDRRTPNIPSTDALNRCLAVLAEDGCELPGPIDVPIVRFADLERLSSGTILAINPDGSARLLYRPESSHNVIFATARCNSCCIMCSQPPVDRDDSSLVGEHLRLIELIQTPPVALGISGGEPTLLKDDLICILQRLKERLPATRVHMLTNGRYYAYEDFVAKIAAVRHSSFVSGIPLYSDVALQHDAIVGAKGAFDQTLAGLYNAGRHGLAVEIRIVLHRLTVPRLRRLAEFLYRNVPFVAHVAMMGLENTGYARKNWEGLWIDPLDCAAELEAAVRDLFYRRMSVSIYNLQLCVLPRSLWSFARQSISDFKNIYMPICDTCDARAQCAGFFASTGSRHSRGIAPIRDGRQVGEPR